MKLTTASREVALRTGVDADIVIVVVQAFLVLVIDELLAAGAVSFRNFGRFALVRRTGGVGHVAPDQLNSVSFIPADHLRKQLHGPR